MSELVASWTGYDVRRQAGGWPGAGLSKRPYAVWLTGPQTLLRTERGCVRTFATPAAAQRAGLLHLRAGWNQRQTLHWERDQYGHYNAADEAGNRYQARRQGAVGGRDRRSRWLLLVANVMVGTGHSLRTAKAEAQRIALGITVAREYGGGRVVLDRRTPVSSKS